MTHRWISASVRVRRPSVPSRPDRCGAAWCPAAPVTGRGRGQRAGGRGLSEWTSAGGPPRSMSSADGRLQAPRRLRQPWRPGPLPAEGPAPGSSRPLTVPAPRRPVLRVAALRSAACSRQRAEGPRPPKALRRVAARAAARRRPAPGLSSPRRSRAPPRPRGSEHGRCRDLPPLRRTPRGRRCGRRPGAAQPARSATVMASTASRGATFRSRASRQARTASMRRSVPSGVDSRAIRSRASRTSSLAIAVAEPS